MRKPVLLGIAAAALVALAGGTAAIAIDRHSARSDVTGDLVDRHVPALMLENASGRATTLAAFHGKVIVLAPFLTLCHEVCPLTTGAFEAMQRSIRRAGLGKRVVFAEVSVDPWRDTAARLRAFARLTGIGFPLLTGTRAELARFWRFFGVAYYRTPEGRPPETDWLTHKPLAFDVGHTDGFFVIDARGRERLVAVGMPQLAGALSKRLTKLLDRSGRRNLVHPDAGWSVQQGLDDVEYVLGLDIAAESRRAGPAAASPRNDATVRQPPSAWPASARG